MLSRVRTRQSAHSNRTSAHSKRIIKQNVFADLVQLADSDCDCEDAVDSSDDEYTPPVKRVCRLGERRPPTKHEMDTEQHQNGMESIACAQDGPETGGRPTKLRDDTISKNKWIHFFNVFRMPQNHNKHRRRGGRSKGFKHTAVTVHKMSIATKKHWDEVRAEGGTSGFMGKQHTAATKHNMKIAQRASFDGPNGKQHRVRKEARLAATQPVIRKMGSVAATRKLYRGSLESLEVQCGELRGTLNLQDMMVTPHGQDREPVSPTRFAKLQGRGAARGWRSTIRVDSNHGPIGLGVWLKQQPQQQQQQPVKISRGREVRAPKRV